MSGAPEICRLKVVVRGAVQGVGFRPFVFRLAHDLELKGWVNNSPQGVFIEVEGKRPTLEDFLNRLQRDRPPRSYIQSLESSWLHAVGYSEFQIRESDHSGTKTTLVMPDLATCPDCLSEIFDPQNRRYFYPFTNCTNCGPRFSIIESLPYDRANTSMKQFVMCPQCQAEYDNPLDRRFHAQPNACSVCGPRLELWNSEAQPVLSSERGDSMQILRAAAESILSGQIVAIKGLGGFHLMAAAHNEGAIQQLRERKHREEKPFAVMFPSLESIRGVCLVSPLEERLVLSPECPIVLLRRLSNSGGTSVSSLAAPGNPNLGVLLPYTPLHHLLLSLLKVPVIATSGNLSDEPICIDEREAVQRLRGIADLFLVHNRPIVRHVDDSIVRVMAGREMVLRRARGYAPLPIQVRSPECGMHAMRSAECGVRSWEPHSVPIPPKDSALRTPHSALTTLAVGGHLKNSVALAIGPQVFISQHIGDLETAQAYGAFERVIADLQRLYESPASLIAADAHPDYLSSKFAQQSSLPKRIVQHHVAHVLSCMAENQLDAPVLGVSWDGTGYGLDGTVWGGEFFRVDANGFKRVAHFRQFRLPGGDQAVREPRRSALGVLFATFGPELFECPELVKLAAMSASELPVLKTMLTQGLNSPLTSSAGRLFDAVAALIGLRKVVRFEGQAAMELEFILPDDPQSDSYGVELDESSVPTVIDWRPTVKALLEDLRTRARPSAMSARFHNTLSEAMIKVAHKTRLEHVVLSGGCFQNRYLTETSIRRLKEEGFRAYWHQRVPPNDGGICLGQAIAARSWKV